MKAPAFKIIDGRDERAKALDAEIEAWVRAHKFSAKPPRPSELRRRGGLRLDRKFGLVRCGCSYFLIARSGQQTALCPRCGRRLWLAELRVLMAHDSERVLRRVISGIVGLAGKKQFTDEMMLRWMIRAEESLRHADGRVNCKTTGSVGCGLGGRGGLLAVRSPLLFSVCPAECRPADNKTEPASPPSGSGMLATPSGGKPLVPAADPGGRMAGPDRVGQNPKGYNR
jgi:hypothetical protein